MARKEIASKKKKPLLAKKKAPVVKKTSKKPAKKIGAKKIGSKKVSVVSKKKTTTKKTAAQPKKKVSWTASGFHTVTPYLFMQHAERAIEFYKSVFGAKEVTRVVLQNGKIGHAELKIGDSKLMLAEECPEMKISASHHSEMAFSIHLYVKNSDSIVEKAVSAGAKVLQSVEDMYWGDRSGLIQDPFGHKWCVSTHIEDVTPAKLKKRAAEFMKSVS